MYKRLKKKYDYNNSELFLLEGGGMSQTQQTDAYVEGMDNRGNGTLHRLCRAVKRTTQKQPEHKQKAQQQTMVLGRCYKCL